MNEGIVLFAHVSDVVLGLAIGIPVVVAAGATAVAVRFRRRRAPVRPEGQAAPPREARAPEAEAPAREAPEAPARPEAEAPAREAPAAPGQEAGAAPVEEAAPVVAAETPVEAEPEVAPATFRGRLGKARGFLAGYLGAVRSRGKVSAETWDDLEEALIRADVGVGATDAMLEDLRRRVKAGEIADTEALVEALKADLVEALTVDGGGLAKPGDAASEGGERPAPGDGDGSAGGEGERTVDVWLFVGVNGVGKTTTVGKVATRLSGTGAKPLLAAGDTFRAAAGEQLAMWADRTGTDIVRGAEGGDPSAVVFDAVQRAAARRYDVVLADTAGRLHNKANLVEELKKIRRVAGRPPGRVTEVLLVIDATTGQNGLAQAKVFTEAVDVTGVVLTKLDGTAKGGIVVAIVRELGLPVKLVGLGEGARDLVDFDPAAFVDAIF